MKKLMVAALLLWSTTTVYAGTPKGEKATGKHPKAKSCRLCRKACSPIDTGYRS